MASSVAALSHLGRERQFGGPLALSKVHWVRPSLNGMQNAVGPEGFDGVFKSEAAMEAKPFASVAMPLDIKAVRADPVEAGEGRIELLAEMVREAGAVARRSRGPCPIRGDRPPGWHDRDRGLAT